MLSGRNADDVTDFHFYYYHPSMAAAILFAILFGIATALHLGQMLRTRTWFMVPFVLGGIFETIGYIGRTLSAQQNPGPYTLGPYIIQSVLLLVAPALFVASIYMELGRIVLMCDTDRALFIRRTWLTKIFVIGDVFTFLVQSSGAGLLASGNASSINTGKDIVVAALFLQVIVFGLFVIAAAIFHTRLAQAPTAKSFEVPWKKHLFGIYVVSFLIFIRSIVRVAEYIQGYSGYLMVHEVYLYVFDGLVMFLAVVAMNWIHPGEIATILRSEQAEKSRTGAEQHKIEGMDIDHDDV